MKAPKLIVKVSRVLCSIPPRRFDVVVCIAILTATFNAIWLVRTPVVYEETITVSSSGQEIRRDVTVPAASTRIGIVLVISALGLLSKKALGFLLSILGFLLVTVDHLNWYLVSQRMKGLSLGSSIIPMEPEGFLWNGAWWNIFVLLITIILLVWELKILTRSFKVHLEQ